MAGTAIFAAGIVFLAVISVAMFRTGRRIGGADWSLAWIALYAAGICAILQSEQVALRVAPPIFGLVFAGFLYTGTLRYCGKTKTPRWLWPGVATIAAVWLVVQPWVPAAAAQLCGVCAIAVSAIECSRRLAAAAPTHVAPGWTWSLAVALPLLPIGAAGYALARTYGAPVEYILLPWLTTGVIVGSLQTGALLVRIERFGAQESASLAALVDAAPFGLAMSDAAGRVQTMNARFAETFGLDDPSRYVGQSFRDLAMELRYHCETPDVAWMTRRDAKELVDREHLPVKEYHFHDGRITHADVRNVYGDNGRFLGQLWLVNDVTEARRIDEQLRRARQLETLGRLASGVAHDFNNQLATMLGNAEAVRDTLAPEDPRGEALAELEQAALYCSGVASDLLDFAQPAPRWRSLTNLGEFLPELVSRLAAGLPENAELSLNVADGLPPISVDRTQLERVVTNLIQNARDAVGEAGHIVVRAEQRSDQSQVAISVSDDGEGMSAATRERIFDPFFSTKKKGTGLGLAITYGIVTAHGGSVSVDSEPGQGTRFVTLWPASSECSAEANASAPTSVAGGNETLLLVEDQPVLQRLVRESLERAGYDVVAVGSGQAALDAYTQDADRIALAVLDYAMPGLSGPQVLERLRAQRPDLPAIFMSGNFAQAAGIGSTPTLAKPFRNAELLALVRSVLDDHDAG